MAVRNQTEWMLPQASAPASSRWAVPPVDPRVCYAFLIVQAAMLTGYIVTSKGFGNITLVDVGGTILYPSDVILVAAVALLLLGRLPGPLSTGRGLTHLAVAVIFTYLAVQLLVILPIAIGVHGFSLFPVLRVLMPRLLVVYIPCLYLVVLRGVPLSRALLVWNVAAVIVCAYAVGSYLITGAAGDSVETGEAFRLRQTYGGASLLEGWLIFMALLYWKPSRLAYALAGLGFLGLTLTNHRSAFLALGAASLFHLVFNRRFASRGFAVIALVLVLVVAFAMLSPVMWESTRYTFGSMFNAQSDGNTRARADAVGPSLEFFEMYPLGDTAWHGEQFEQGIAEPHNLILQLMTQEGLVGTLFWLFLIVVTFAVGWRNRQTDRLTATLLSFFVFVLVFIQFNTTIRGLDEFAIIAFCIAIIYRQSDLIRQSRAEAQLATHMPPWREPADQPSS
jgi:O-antigen ligase